jgi:hypothetical protein
MIPWSPAPFARAPLDDGYTIFSHIALAQGMPWGAGTLHTTGPLGFLRFPFFHPDTFALLILGLGALGATLALLIHEVVRRTLPTWLHIPVVLGTTWVVSFNDDAGWMLILLMSHLLLPCVTPSASWSLRPAPPWAAWPTPLGLAVSAAAANVKGTLILMAAGVAVEIAALELGSRRAPVASASFVAGIGLIPLLTGFHLGDWPAYLEHIWGSLSGYPESFSKAGSLPTAVLLVSGVLAFLALAARSGPNGTGRFVLVVRCGALALLLLWIVAKGALVRQDLTHEIRAVMVIALFYGLFVVMHFRAWSRGVAALALLPAVVLVSIILPPKSEPMQMRSRPLQRAHPFLSFLRTRKAVPITRDAQARREVALQVPHPWTPANSIAVFGTYQSLALSHPGRYVTLPIIAPDEVWSPWTSRRERDFLTGPEAPDYLIYTTSPTSAELALALNARYEQIDRGPHHRLLRHRLLPLSVSRRLILDREVDAGDTIPISPDWRESPLVAEISYTKTIPNLLISSLYQPPEAFVVLLQGETVLARIRMNSLLSGEGIVLAGRAGTWDGAYTALHGIRYDLLANERTEATALTFEARGAVGTQWARYFDRRVHVRIYMPEFRQNVHGHHPSERDEHAPTTR